MIFKNKRGSILIVDDHDELRATLAYLFVDCGFRVRQACNGFGALAAIRSEVPDVLISDLNMPAMCGFELLSIVRQRFPSIGVIAMSGAYSEDLVPKGVAADAFYAKGSCTPDSLFVKVKALMERGISPGSRPEAPIWIYRLTIECDRQEAHLVCCPDCLRMYGIDSR